MTSRNISDSQRDRQARQYVELDESDQTRYVCGVCGAVVVERFVHADWHEAEANYIRIPTDAVEGLPVETRDA